MSKVTFSKSELNGVIQEFVKRVFERDQETYTITYGEVAENHANMQKLGNKTSEGLTISDLRNVKKVMETLGAKCELIKLNRYLPEGVHAEDAYILVVRKGVNYILKKKCADDMFREHKKLKPDTKAFMRGQVKNKIARHNLCFSDFSQEADFENKKGTVIDFKDPQIELTNRIREKIPFIFSSKGEEYKKVSKLQAEGNYYYSEKCGIGFHGDSERMIVIAVRLGKTMCLHYQWFTKFKPIGDRCILNINHGDMYFMSEKATGNDWKKSSIVTLRHAAGSSIYTTIKTKK
jgi:hypothetical protein